MDGLGEAAETSPSPLLSVVMSVYNGEACLDKTIQSILDHDPVQKKFFLCPLN